jgi:hypothetical protein
MDQQENRETVAVSVPANRTTLLGGVALGLLLLAIGGPTNSEWVVTIGAFVLSLASFWGGLFLANEKVAIRVVLIAVAGFVAVSAFLGTIGLSSLLR